MGAALGDGDGRTGSNKPADRRFVPENSRGEDILQWNFRIRGKNRLSLLEGPGGVTRPNGHAGGNDEFFYRIRHSAIWSGGTGIEVSTCECPEEQMLNGGQKRYSTRRTCATPSFHQFRSGPRLRLPLAF